MLTMNQIITSVTDGVKHQVIESLQEAGYDNVSATKLVTQFEGLSIEDLTFESDSKF
jgi:hypothetical protein